MRRSNKHLFDEVAFLGIRTDDPLSAPALTAIGCKGHPLDITVMRQGDYHVLIGDEVLDTEVAHVANDLSPTSITESLLDLIEILANYVQQQGLLLQNSLMPINFYAESRVFLCELFDLQPGQSLELHRQNRVRLNVREIVVFLVRPGDKRGRQKLADGSLFCQTQR